MTPRELLLGVALLAATGFALFGDKRPAGATSVPARAAANVAITPVLQPGAVTIVRLQYRGSLLGTSAVGGDDDAFASHNWTPAVKPAAVAPPPLSPPPKAPPLPFTFLGKAVSNGEWEVFLARGNETLVVRDKTVIGGVYRIDSIAPPGMTFTYLPLKQVQQLNIGVLD
ncbi:MAG: hypothetical protein JWM36_4809 [Hyphomicrobiales bacterium]|nr:hypothetical protein [Hyphomicrobiales bacterium]